MPRTPELEPQPPTPDSNAMEVELAPEAGGTASTEAPSGRLSANAQGGDEPGLSETPSLMRPSPKVATGPPALAHPPARPLPLAKSSAVGDQVGAVPSTPEHRKRRFRLPQSFRAWIPRRTADANRRMLSSRFPLDLGTALKQRQSIRSIGNSIFRTPHAYSCLLYTSPSPRD